MRRERARGREREERDAAATRSKSEKSNAIGRGGRLLDRLLVKKAINRARVPPRLVARDAIFRPLRSSDDIALDVAASGGRELFP